MLYHRYPFLYYLFHWSQYLFSISCLLTNYVGFKHALYKFFTLSVATTSFLMDPSFVLLRIMQRFIQSIRLHWSFTSVDCGGLFVSFFQMKRFCSFWWTVPPFIRFPLLCNFGFPLLCHNYSLYSVICQYIFIYFII